MNVFTFGFGHLHPLTGESLASCYIVLPGSPQEARVRMAALFGRKWAFQYCSREHAGVAKWKMREVALTAEQTLELVSLPRCDHCGYPPALHEMLSLDALRCAGWREARVVTECAHGCEDCASCNGSEAA